jgi:acetyl-CoA carboxylase biotin carboxylase subunit/propionyl-CoA carboxylase alpha chain
VRNQNISKILIANRGVPAVRIINTCHERKISTVAVYSTPDRLSYHVQFADSAVHIGEAPPVESYLNMERIVNAALKTKAQAIHPGWGFLAENSKFAQMVEDAGLIWVGPKPSVIELMGDKIRSKKIAKEVGVPIIPSLDNITHSDEILAWMRESGITYPLLIKASAGGGGKGMVKVNSDQDLKLAIEQAKSEARKSFASDTLLVEKYFENSKHIEVQVVGDEFGKLVHLYDRECTIQRRNQKIVEESPSPSIDDEMREKICQCAVNLMKRINYTSAGTVEFIYDADAKKFYFLEVNTRLQVEHGITELVTGIDIVSIMLDVAQKSTILFHQKDVVRNRCALEVRINAEDPINFSPSFGTIQRLRFPIGHSVRVLEGAVEGSTIPPYYDSLVMLVMSAGRNREDAIKVMDRALTFQLKIEGIKTLQPLLLKIIRHRRFMEAKFTTQFIDRFLDELVASITEKKGEDEIFKIAQYIAEISALGSQSWM